MLIHEGILENIKIIRRKDGIFILITEKTHHIDKSNYLFKITEDEIKIG